MSEQNTRPGPSVFLDLPRIPNPIPEITHGGDCYACAAAVVIRALTGNKVSVEEVIDYFPRPHGDPFTSGNGWREFIKNLREKHGIRAHQHFPVPRFQYMGEGWEIPGWRLDGSHAQDIVRGAHAYLCAGWVGTMPMHHAGEGPVSKVDGDVYWNNLDHIVVVDGARWGWHDAGDGVRTLRHDLHLVDSSRTDLSGWHDAMNLYRKHGLAGFVWFRRDVAEGDDSVE